MEDMKKELKESKLLLAVMWITAAVYNANMLIDADGVVKTVFAAVMLLGAIYFSYADGKKWYQLRKELKT